MPREKKAALRGSALSLQQNVGRGTSWLLFYIRNKMEKPKAEELWEHREKKPRM